MDLGLAIDFFRGRDSSGSEPAPWKPVRSGSAAVCAGLRCLLLVVIVSRPGPNARLFFVLRMGFLNLGDRGSAADQTLASKTLVPLRPESGIPDRLTSDVSPPASVASGCSHRFRAVWTTQLGSRAMHSTRQIPRKSRSRPPSAQTAVAQGIRSAETISNLYVVS